MPNPALSSAVAKVERRLIPFLMLIFLVAFLDRANVGFAKADLQISVGISESAFALGAGLFFITYALLEVPSTMMMHRMGAKFWMSRIMVTWGLASAALMFTQGPHSFYALRLLLGAAEAGLFPAAIYYMGCWFPDESRGRAIGYFFVAAPIALVVGGPVSGLLLGLDGVLALSGWQWMFLVEGLASCVVGLWAFWYMDDTPAKARWLTVEERAALVEHLALETASKKGEEVSASWRQLLADSKLWRATGVHFFGQIGSYGIIFYLPAQVSALLGKKMGLEVGIVSALPWAVAGAACIWLPSLADKTERHRLMSFGLFAIGGVSLALTAYGSPSSRMLFMCVSCAALVAVCPIYWTFLPRYQTGEAAARGIGFASSLGIVGAFIAPNLRALVSQTTGAPVYGLLAIACAALVGALCVSTLRWPINFRSSAKDVEGIEAPRTAIGGLGE
ncbi:MFS transporter [Caballeronia sp. GaOx3]|uniref:MFS transporter n=1 Tax=Caballeronia sp. GaOx3 TaxID=2921740 RepID=UPI002028045D|nr:MFS transporter [Caballeronia sp. GaOx3]